MRNFYTESAQNFVGIVYMYLKDIGIILVDRVSISFNLWVT